MKTDIEIARSVPLKPISEVAQNLGIDADQIETYGKTVAKLPLSLLQKEKRGKLVLVTAITATKAGIGKTTVSIGLALGLNAIGKKACVALREPSLGPCFGMKGGAAGGGYAQVLPMERINLHFTGDFHAITSAHNMIAALLDNYLYQHRAEGFGLNPLASRARRERPLLAQHRDRTRSLRQRHSAASRFRHHTRFGTDGNSLSRSR